MLLAGVTLLPSRSLELKLQEILSGRRAVCQLECGDVCSNQPCGEDLMLSNAPVSFQPEQFVMMGASLAQQIGSDSIIDERRRHAVRAGRHA